MSLLEFFLINLKVSLITFGGSAPLPLLQDELVRQRGVLLDQDFASAMAIGLITPGPNGLFVVPVGYFVGGIPGALIAAMALCLVAVGVLGLLRVHGLIAHHRVVMDGTRGVRSATIGLMLTLGYMIVLATVRTPLDATIAVLAFALLAFTRLDVLWIVAAAAAMGLLTLVMG